jgi:hypothetical protein
MADDSQITCPLCNKPIDLEFDLYTDGDGKAIHEDCYAKKIAPDRNSARDPVAGEGAA